MGRPIKELKEKVEIYMNNSDIVLVCPHIDPDCDAIASALGFYMIASQLNKKVYIVIDDNVVKIENGVNTIINDLPSNIRIITKSKALNMCKISNALLVMVDTNKENLVPFDSFEQFKFSVIIDHHQTDDKTVKANYTYIDLDVSSAAEIMYKLMASFHIKMDGRNLQEPILIPNISNYLLSGIVLDTNNFNKNYTDRTSDIVTKLMRNGANMDYVHSLFLDDFQTDMRVQNLVGKTNWKMFNFGITYNTDDPNFVYNKEDLAKAADWLLKYKGTDASFVLGFIRDGLVYISARSKGIVDVGEIMSQLGGGGNLKNAAAAIPSEDIASVKSNLEEVIRPGHKFENRPKQLLLTNSINLNTDNK